MKKLLQFHIWIAVFDFFCHWNYAQGRCGDEAAWVEPLRSHFLVQNKRNSSGKTYVLGGSFAVHNVAGTKDENSPSPLPSQRCSCQYQENVFLVEAMIFAINEINSRTDILPDATLGYKIAGSCESPSENTYYALDEYTLLDKLSQRQGPAPGVLDDRIAPGDPEEPVVAIIGPSGSYGSTSVADLLRHFHVPVISYGATINDLSKRVRFPNLFRTVFSDDRQAEALARLCEFFNWTFVAAIGSDDDLGRQGVSTFKRKLESKKMCLSMEAYFNLDATDQDEAHLFHIIDNLKRKREANGVVNVALLFMDWRYAYKFLMQANSQQLANMTWLGVDHWTSNVGMTYLMPDDYLPAPYTAGSISTQPPQAYISYFVQYLRKNIKERLGENRWLMNFYCQQCRHDELYEFSHKNCTLEMASSDECLKSVNLTAILRRQRHLTNVFASVYAAAHALQAVQEKAVGVWDIVDGARLSTALEKVNFTYKLGGYNSPFINFLPGGDLRGARFDFLNFYQADPKQCHLPSQAERVGAWLELNHIHGNVTEDLRVNASMIRWVSDEESDGPPPSYCHVQCAPGEHVVPGPSACCWSCEPCPVGFYSSSYGQYECKPCAEHEYSNDRRTACISNRRVWIGYADTIGMATTGLCILGELLTLAAAIMCFFAHKRKAADDGDVHAMKIVVFINCAIGYSYPVIVFASPTEIRCTLRAVLLEILVTADIAAKFLMLARGRRLALRLAKLCNLLNYRRWCREMCYLLIMTACSCCYCAISFVFAPSTVAEYDLASIDEDDSSSQSTQTMLDCHPNCVMVSVLTVSLFTFSAFNFCSSFIVYRDAKRRRFESSDMNVKRTRTEFHAGNQLWSTYLVVLVLAVVLPFYSTTEDPWSRGVFRVLTPFLLNTILLLVFATPRCWRFAKSVYCPKPENDHLGSVPFIIMSGSSKATSTRQGEQKGAGTSK